MQIIILSLFYGFHVRVRVVCANRRRLICISSSLIFFCIFAFGGYISSLLVRKISIHAWIMFHFEFKRNRNTKKKCFENMEKSRIQSDKVTIGKLKYPKQKHQLQPKFFFYTPNVLLVYSIYLTIECIRWHSLVNCLIYFNAAEKRVFFCRIVHEYKFKTFQKGCSNKLELTSVYCDKFAHQFRKLCAYWTWAD